MAEYVSQREFAKRIGCSEGNLRKAIKAGKLSKSVIRDENGRPKIDYELGLKEYKQNYDFRYFGRNEKTIPIVTGATEADEVEAPEQKAVNKMLMAKEAKAVYDAKLAQLEYERETGKLVEKQVVYRALFAAGQRIRDRLQGIPARVIDDMLAAPSRIDALTILTKEIHGILEDLSNMNEITIK